MRHLKKFDVKSWLRVSRFNIEIKFFWIKIKILKFPGLKNRNRYGPLWCRERWSKQVQDTIIIIRDKLRQLVDIPWQEGASPGQERQQPSEATHLTSDNEMKFAQLLLFHQSEIRILEADQSGQSKQREQVESCDLVTNRFAQLW